MNYSSEIKSIEGFIRQEHYRDAGNVMGRILERALLDAYQSFKSRATPNQQRKLLDAEELVASGRKIDSFTLGQLAGLYREGQVMKLMTADTSFQITRSARIPINDLIEIRNRCAHPSAGAEISLEELEYFLSSLKILIREFGMVGEPATAIDAEAELTPIICMRCKETVDGVFRYCPHCGSRLSTEAPKTCPQPSAIVDLGGHYISHFDDEIDGEVSRVSAKATLYNEGGLVVGETWLLGSKRSWRIEGTVSAQGYFYGIYYAIDPVDRGLGNFFLHILPDRKLNGLWAGYDSANGQITSGRYSFVPSVQNLALVRLERVHVSRVIRIADAQLGSGFISPDDLAAIEQQPDECLGIVAVDEDTARIVGFGLTYIVGPSDSRRLISWPEQKIPESVGYVDRVGILKTVAVREDYQGRGVGYAIVEESLRKLREFGVETVCAIAWKAGEKTNIGGILKNLEFFKYREVPNYWKMESEERGYECPRCGPPPCLCTGVIYLKEPYS